MPRLKSFPLVALVATLTSLLTLGCGGGGGGGGGAQPPVQSNNADLADLVISVAPLDQPFQPNLLNYTANTGFAGATTSVTATTDDANATLTVDGVVVMSGVPSALINLAPGADTDLTIEVTAENGVDSKVYVVTVTRAGQSNNADLADLGISLALLDQAFQANLLNYTADTGFLGASTRAIAVTDDANATLTVNGVAVPSGVPSALIDLAQGADTDLTIEVTAEDGVTQKAYVVTVTREAAGTFAQQAYAKASNTDAGDEYGRGIAVWGDTMAVGAINEASDATGIDGVDNNNLASAGAVYVFVRDGVGAWDQQAYVKASNTNAGDRFGASVAMSGDTLAVGAPGEASLDAGNEANNNGNNVGAVYVFTRNGVVWSQQAYLKASNLDSGDEFARVALDGDTLVVGAPGEGGDGVGVNNNLQDAGAAYVFERGAGGVWNETAYLKASNPDTDDLFSLVGVSGPVIVVGAPGEDGDGVGVNNNLQNAGAAYVFEQNAGGNWSEVAYLKASNPDSGDLFSRVGVSADIVAVGAPGEAGDGAGNNNNAPDAGAAYVFERNGAGNWLETAYLKASNVDPGDGFGNALAVSGGALVIGAGGEQSSAVGINGNQANNTLADAGAAYALIRDDTGTWNQVAYIKPSTMVSNRRFGDNVALDRDTLGVSSILEASNAQGINGNEVDTSQPSAGAGYFFD